MSDFIFVTSNQIKLTLAERVCARYNLSFTHEHLDMVEIQSDSGEAIAKHKAEQAFATFKTPVIITDDSWIMPGLNGWPGTLMKYMNQWLTTDDFARLTAPLTDRRVILRQVIVYQDAREQKVFYKDVEGTLLAEPRGSSHIPSFPIISFDGIHSAAEQAKDGYSAITSLPTSWDDFCEWFTQERARVNAQ